MLALLNLRGNTVPLAIARALDWSPTTSSALLIDFAEMIFEDNDGWYPLKPYYETMLQRELQAEAGWH
jgi:hypothetical protein